MKAPEALPLTPAVVVWSMPESASARSCMLSSPDSDSIPGTAPAVSWLALPDWSPLGTLDAAVSWLALPDWSPLGTLDAPESVPVVRSGEHTSELQTRENLVCRL